MKQATDVAAMLPDLSRYMGHATFDSTYYYVHTSPDFIDSYAEIDQARPVTAARGRIPMRRDPKSAPDFYSLRRRFPPRLPAQDQGLSPKTIEAYRISLERYLNDLADTERIGNPTWVSFDHFDRPHLKGWMTWICPSMPLRAQYVLRRASAPSSS